MPDGCAALVCYFQAWHWMPPAQAGAEAARVLRPGGALVLVWNEVDAEDTGWWQRQQDRLEAANPAYSRGYRRRNWQAELAGVCGLGPLTETCSRWTRHIPVDDYLVWLRSKSYVAELRAHVDDFLDAERDSMLSSFPSGIVAEPFRTSVFMARRS